MGFTSIADISNKLTSKGGTWRTDWQRAANFTNTGTAGRWYDLTMCYGIEPAGAIDRFYGELVTNPYPDNPVNSPGWSLGASWSWNSAPYFAKAGTSLDNLSQTSMNVVAGHTYLLMYTLGGLTGSVTPSIGGTNGTTQSVGGTFIEKITAVNGTTLIFTPAASGNVMNISNVHVLDCLQSSALSDTMLNGSMFHGGNVSPMTKHLLNAGVRCDVATMTPGLWVLCDMLLAYPGIDMNSNALQTLTTGATLPRYTNGKGVRAFIIPQKPLVTTGANAHFIDLKYTNTTPTSGKGLPATVAGTIGTMPYHLYHSGVAANNYGPFLPMSNSDAGITKLDSIQFTAAGGTANSYATAVLCKPLAMFQTTIVNQMTEIDFLSQHPSLPRIYDGACLGLLFLGGGVLAGSTATGFLEFGWA